MGKLVDTDELYADFRRDIMGGLNYDRILREAKPVDAVPVVRCRDCKHNPKIEWFGCPMASLSEKQRPETAWCWKGERKDDDNG